jgi:DNA-binding transcriptional regulator YhcF (GntR family)
MQLRIDNSSDRPVYQQIIDQVKRDIALGRVVKDERLPTVRQLAGQLAINPNTIQRRINNWSERNMTRPARDVRGKPDSDLSGSVKKKLIYEDLELAVVDAFTCRLTANAAEMV